MRFRLCEQPQLCRALLNKALEPHGITLEKGEEEKAGDYAFECIEAYEAWKGWCLEILLRKFNWTQRHAEMEFDIFDLSMGLKHSYPPFTHRVVLENKKRKRA